MLQHLGSYLNPNRVSFKWPWAEMLCCLIDGVISFQGYHFPCLFSCLMLSEHSQAVKHFIYWQDKPSGAKTPALLHCSSTEKWPSPDGPQQNGMGQAPTGATQSQGDAVLHGMGSASHPARRLKVPVTGNWTRMSQAINNLAGTGVGEVYRTILIMY